MSLLLLLLLLLLTEKWKEGCQGVKTERRELRHESMKCTTKSKQRRQKWWTRAGGRLRNAQGPGGTKASFFFFLVFPVFLDVEVPLPGQVVVLVIISKLGFDVVVAAGHNTFRSLLHRGQEVVFIGTRPVAAHHVVRLIDC